jgi:hypothetical protein
VRITVTVIAGSVPPDTAFTQAVMEIGEYEGEIYRHPDVLMRVRPAADIATARDRVRTGKNLVRVFSETWKA